MEMRSGYLALIQQSVAPRLWALACAFQSDTQVKPEVDPRGPTC